MLVKWGHSMAKVLASICVVVAGLAANMAIAQTLPTVNKAFAEQPAGEYVLDRAHASVV